MKTQSSPPKILVIDDDAEFLADLKTWLTNEGFKAHVAQVGKAGIQCFRLYHPYDAVILDLHMPKVDGFQVLREIKDTDLNVKVAVLTGDTSARDRVNALGADAFVVKPIGRKGVCELVRNLLGNAN